MITCPFPQGDWEATLGSNTPGHSGNPDSPYYKHFLDTWANDEYFEVGFDREKIEEGAVEKWVMK